MTCKDTLKTTSVLLTSTIGIKQKLSWKDSMKVTADGLGLSSNNGFRSAHCNAPIQKGQWYTEVKIEPGGGERFGDNSKWEGAHVRSCEACISCRVFTGQSRTGWRSASAHSSKFKGINHTKFVALSAVKSFHYQEWLSFKLSIKNLPAFEFEVFYATKLMKMPPSVGPECRFARTKRNSMHYKRKNWDDVSASTYSGDQPGK